MSDLFSVYQNLGDYLFLRSWFPFFKLKKLLPLEFFKTSDVEYCRWQRTHCGILEIVVRRLNLSDRIRLGLSCKSWASVCMPGDVRGAQELPWLLLPRICDDSMRFLSPFDGGKFHKLRVPEPIQRGRLFGSSKGWLFMVREKQKDMFLFNPISGAQRQLPSLTTIPSFQNFVETKAWKLHGASIFCVHTVLSTSDVDHPGCMVAAIFGSHVLGLCRPGDKTWSVFEVLDENEGHDQLLFSSTGKLYSLVTSETKNELIVAHSLQFGDDHAVELMLIYDNIEPIEPDIYHHECYTVTYNGAWKSFLLESTNNEVLLIHKWHHIFQAPRNADNEDGYDQVEHNFDDNYQDDQDDEVEEEENGKYFSDKEFDIDTEEENVIYSSDNESDIDSEDENTIYSSDNESDIDSEDKNAIYSSDNESDIDDEDENLRYYRASCFRVFKIDAESSKFIVVQSLEGQVLFLTDCSSFSLRASDFRELNSNCIYFADNSTHSVVPKLFTYPEIGVFSLDNGRFERYFINIPTGPRTISWIVPSL
ncbi:uncharacterized protein LOC125470972 [Pyrus x bretschneideri]|uniref:uncharacterized protein LOC125470972 n=1 Tax=Pyrus x bretschneideri TaxID=225117 RepID=UPI00202E97A2|nr:uncharacterized protein LOC125470972 [Pyrus x bretschneideri]